LPKGWIQKSNKYSNVLQTGFKTGLACAVRKMTHKFLGMIHTIVIYGENKQEFHRGVTIEYETELNLEWPGSDP